jgi:hypothetical protein
MASEDRVLDGSAWGGKGSKGRNYLYRIRGNHSECPDSDFCDPTWGGQRVEREDRALDEPSWGENGSKGRIHLDCFRCEHSAPPANSVCAPGV